MKAIQGKLCAFAKTGTEGIIWSLVADHDKEQHSYDNLYALKDGDALVIYDNDTVVFCGVIDLDYQVNLAPFPWALKELGPDHPDIRKYSQTRIKGNWCHGVQRSVKPETWLEFFNKELSAVLVRKGRYE